MKQTIIHENKMEQSEFEHIAHRLRSKAHGIAILYGFSQDDAEDVAQDVMLKLWGMHEAVECGSRIDAYVGIMAKHCCIDRIRTRRSDVRLDDTIEVVSNESQADMLEYKELETWLDKRISNLPSTSGIILRMRQIENRELDEIASILGISKASVSTLLSRARRQLLDELKRRNKR